jgi:hypothetical protein
VKPIDAAFTVEKTDGQAGFLSLAEEDAYEDPSGLFDDEAGESGWASV